MAEFLGHRHISRHEPFRSHLPQFLSRLRVPVTGQSFSGQNSAASVVAAKTTDPAAAAFETANAVAVDVAFERWRNAAHCWELAEITEYEIYALLLQNQHSK